MVVARFADRLARFLHGDQIGLARGVADVVALQAGGGGQHDVGHLGGRRPELLMEHHRLGLAPGEPQPVEILMVMKRIAARPIDQADVGIDVLGAVVGEALAGMQQHVGDACHRNELAHRVGALRQGRAGMTQRTAAHQVRRPVAAGEAAAGQADLAQHGGQGDQRPERLLAVVRALQRPADAQHGAAGRHLARQGHDAMGGDAGDLLGPPGVLGLAVALRR